MWDINFKFKSPRPQVIIQNCHFRNSNGPGIHFSDVDLKMDKVTLTGHKGAGLLHEGKGDVEINRLNSDRNLGPGIRLSGDGTKSVIMSRALQNEGSGLDLSQDEGADIGNDIQK